VSRVGVFRPIGWFVSHQSRIDELVLQFVEGGRPDLTVIHFVGNIVRRMGDTFRRDRAHIPTTFYF
jgi:hypothetical protein